MRQIALLLQICPYLTLNHRHLTCPLYLLNTRCCLYLNNTNGIYPSNLSTIIGLIQLNALNFHTNGLLLRINNTWLLVYHSIGLLLHTRLIALLLLPKALSNIGLNQVKLQPLPTTRNHHILSSQFHFHSSGLVYFSPTGNILNFHTQVLKFRLSATSNPVPMLSTNNTYLLLRSHALLLMTKPMSKDLT